MQLRLLELDLSFLFWQMYVVNQRYVDATDYFSTNIVAIPNLLLQLHQSFFFFSLFDLLRLGYLIYLSQILRMTVGYSF